VSFPEATSIGSGAFSGCTALTTISFPAVQTMGIGAFAIANSANNVLTSITIGAQVDLTNLGGSLPTAFITYYDNASGGNKRAGTYVLSGSAWTGPN
jgi:hypothetical protein